MTLAEGGTAYFNALPVGAVFEWNFERGSTRWCRKIHDRAVVSKDDPPNAEVDGDEGHKLLIAPMAFVTIVRLPKSAAA